MRARQLVVGATAIAVLIPAAAAAAPGVLDTETSSLDSGMHLTDTRPVPEVLAGDTWLRHVREDLLPYWDMPEALGDPIGNFPTFRDGQGQPDPGRGTWRGVSTVARGVYGYSVAFHLTGEERYLEYARAGLQYLQDHAFDEGRGGWFHDLLEDGSPRDASDHKELFDLASVGMAFGMYVNVTREPWAEEGLLAVRDLIFTAYHNPVNGRFFDARTADMTQPVDLGAGSGQDLTNLLVPGPGMLLPNADVLSDPGRRAQFREDLRTVVDELLNRHRNGDTPETWWFWGRANRRNHGAPETDFGHTIKSHELIHNANQVFPDRPWSDLSADRDTALQQAWDAEAARWHQDIAGFGGTPDRDSTWWVHNEADQTLAAVDLREDFARSDWLARSARSWLDVFVDPVHPHETWTRPGRRDAAPNLEKSARGKNMYHVFEHALVMFLHGRAMEGRPAALHYALPAAVALTAEAEPYWFDATTEHRTVGEPVEVLEGHRHVTVELSGLDSVPDPLFPAPPDELAPTTTATLDPSPNEAGWSRTPVTLTLSSTDDLAGVAEVRAQVEDLTGASLAEAWIEPGDALTLSFVEEGDFVVRYGGVDRVGNTEVSNTIRVRVDLTPPTVRGLPDQPCRIWPPDGRMVQVAEVRAEDAFSGLSGLSGLDVTVSVNEPAPGDVEILGERVVRVRAARSGNGDGRVYTVTATATDTADNVRTASADCAVPHDRRP